MKAMILAAGRGERLRPLTDTIPKPLIEVGGRRLIEHHLLKLQKSGVNDVVINVCYRADDIRAALGDGSQFGLSVTYSDETSGCLGTGGGVCHALNLLGNQPFLLLSADIWTDYSFSSAMLQDQPGCHLLLVDNPHYHLEGDYGLAEDNRLSLSGDKFTYGGIARIDPVIFQGCSTEKVVSLAPLLEDAIMQGCATGERYQGRWFNVGTKEELANVNEHS
jgi:MurNAc alpha-1-phosphate uridylyltransferase